MTDSLKKYREKRNFAVTSEPADGGEANEEARAFVIQKHWASHLHYDFRLELDGAMKSWAVPKGPSYDPSVKRMAVQVEDHPIAYNEFEGQIPKGEYGAGKVIIWDEGSWTPVGDALEGYRAGHLKFDLHGVKMQGRWALVRMKGKETDKQPAWLLIKDRDGHARAEREFSVVDEMPDSVVPLRKRVSKTKAKTTADSNSNSRANAKASKRKQAPTSDDEPLPGQAADLPDSMKPQLATLADGVPGGAADWLYEVKFDGYRLMARLDASGVKLYTRNGHDWSEKMPHLLGAFRKLPSQCAWVDGEVVVLNDSGVPSFQALQNAFDSERTRDIIFYAFDLPFIGGRDLRQEPLTVRRGLLAQLMAAGDAECLRFSEDFDVAPDQLVASACKMGLEGIMAKRRSSPYVSRRTDSWIKVKCAQRQEFVIVGYTAPKGGRVGLGALLLAVHEADGALRYAGKVGTGFDDQGLRHLQEQLARIKTDAKPVAVAAAEGKGVQWVRPEVVAEVSFGDWTDGGHIRHAVFRGLRQDKPARNITREKTVHAKDVKAPAGNASAVPAAGRLKPGKLTHPDRIIDASTGGTKLDLARYYGLVAPLLLHHLKARPVSFLRAPSGIDGQLFFQKHLESDMPGVLTLPVHLDPGHAPLLEVATLEAVMSAVQMNVVEFHTWNATKDAIAKPDRMTFDLDPGAGVAWTSMRQAAKLVRIMLEELGLRAWLKTSGGKGLHVVVPLRRQYDWDTVKAFSQAIVRHLAQTLPQLFVAKSGPSNRVGKIFADYLRNGFGATTVAAWSARARPGLGVSVPVAWDELEKISGGAHWNISNIHTRLDVANAPWDDYTPQALGGAMSAMGFKATAASKSSV
ncbi:DNA ligase D [Achromobacter seleniivolatilans]|uniref:DNA ligase (ATP) n=1 Tax=Achromobacter seleniivolatilans TaxID=3047478 RepID=A0ABY9M5V2_9BURK|nr:DNA ligase D [Achromobacter sp. R39]WMD22366.1 DNA ligase D [Achromobacter sp. R39]